MRRAAPAFEILMLAPVRRFFPEPRQRLNGSWRCSRALHPSEDLSELPPLRVAVAGQEYQRWCCHRKTDRPRSAFWTNGPANHLPCRIDAVALHRWVIARFPMSLANSLSLHGTPADVFPLLDIHLRRFRTDFLWLLKKPLTIYPDSKGFPEKNRENFQ